MGAVAPAGAQDPAPEPLTIVAIEIEPESPGPETLCRMRVRVRNGGERTASALAFTVAINGRELPVYTNQLFLQAIPPGATETVALYNFWTTETQRPLAADRKLRLEVTLREAQWMAISDEEGVEVWRPLGEVDGLPVRAERTLELAGAPAS
jgi:hypothetical protein